MNSTEVLQVIGITITIIIGIGSIIYGIIKLNEQAKKEAIKLVKTTNDEMEKEMEIIDKKVTDSIIRLNELDVWRKEMNGQLKLIRRENEYTNGILTTQGAQLQLITESVKQVSITLAVMSESLKYLKDETDENKKNIGT